MGTITNNELAKQLGDVREQIGMLVESNKHAATGRGVLHEKLDKLIDAIQVQAVAMAGVSKDAALASAGAAQARDRVDAFDREIVPVISELSDKVTDLETINKEEVGPLLKIVGQVRAIGIVIIAISSAGVLSLGGLLTFFNNAAKIAVLNWLGLA